MVRVKLNVINVIFFNETNCLGAPPHELQAAAAAGAGYGALHNNLPPALNNYPRPPLQVGYDPHSQMRAPVVPSLGGIPGGKP